jgi:hypothetical protein
MKNHLIEKYNLPAKIAEDLNREYQQLIENCNTDITIDEFVKVVFLYQC